MPNRTRTLIKTAIGSVIEVVRPDLARAIDDSVPRQDADKTLHAPGGWKARAQKWIVEARMERARLRRDDHAVSETLAGFWRSEAANFFYDRFRGRFEHSFLGPHHIIVDKLAEQVRSGRFSALIEVGCGDGRVLDHCATAMPELDALVGLDINPAIIAENRKTWAGNPRLSFQCGDATKWLDSLVGDGTILMTYGGVMEYLDQASLMRVYRTVAKHRNVAVAMVEPLSPDHDLALQPESFTFGVENSFSHNYPHLLKRAGFKEVFSQEMDWDGVRWILMLATSGIGRDQ